MRSTVELYFLSPSSKGNSDLYVTTVIITAKKKVKAMIVLHTPCHSGVGRCFDKGGSINDQITYLSHPVEEQNLASVAATYLAMRLIL